MALRSGNALVPEQFGDVLQHCAAPLCRCAHWECSSIAGILVQFLFCNDGSPRGHGRVALRLEGRVNCTDVPDNLRAVL
jgi:hypothetical protein